MPVSRSVATLLLSLALFLGSVWLAPCASCQESAPNQFELEYVGSAMWGVMNDIVRNGNYVYCAMANGLQILDISDPTNPTLAKRVFLNRIGLSVELKGDRLYLGCLDGSLHLFDVSDPVDPISLAEVDVSFGRQYQKGIRDIFPRNDTAFLACESGMHIVNLTDLYNPEIVGSYVPLDAYPVTSALGLVGDTAYLCAYRFILLDVSDPLQPTKITEYHMWGEAYGIEVRDNLIFVADRDVVQPSGSSRLLILDAAEPDTLLEVGSFTLPGYLNSISIVDSFVFCATEYSGVAVLDVTDPTSPIPIGCFFPPLGYATHVEVSGDLAFVSNHAPEWQSGVTGTDLCGDDSLAITNPPVEGAKPGDFIILDVSDPTSPEMIGDFPFYGWARTVTIHDDYAYVGSDMGGMAIIDISNPMVMHEVSWLDTYPTDAKVAIIDSLIVVAGQHLGIQVVNVADKTTPRILCSLAVDGSASGLAAQGDYLYVAVFPNGLLILDISDPAIPGFVGSVITPGAALKVAVRGEHAYVADRGAGLQVIDISDPANPIIVSSRGGYVTQVELLGHLLFSASDSLEIIDVSSSPDLVLLGAYGQSWEFLYDLAVSVDIVCMAQAISGIGVFDVSNPAEPELVSTWDSPGAAMGTAATDDHILVADVSSLIAMKLPDLTGIEELPNQGELLPHWYQFYQNYPNPFNPTTTIEYDLPRSSPANLTVYNIMGQKVRTLVDEPQSAGHHTVTWDGRDSRGRPVASGVYFYRLTAGDESHSKKMLLLK